MRVYVAANARVSVWRARGVMADITAAGHEITFDWTRVALNDDYERRAAALAMRSAVTGADALVLLWSDPLLGALLELGMALGAGKLAVLSGAPDSVFWHLPGVRRVPTDDLIVSSL